MPAATSVLAAAVADANWSSVAAWPLTGVPLQVVLVRPPIVPVAPLMVTGFAPLATKVGAVTVPPKVGASAKSSVMLPSASLVPTVRLGSLLVMFCKAVSALARLSLLACDRSTA